MKDDSQDKIFTKMANAAVKEKYSELYRKYDHKTVLKAWAATVKDVRQSVHDNWSPGITLQQALDSLDDSFDPVESLIEGKEKSSFILPATHRIGIKRR